MAFGQGAVLGAECPFGGPSQPALINGKHYFYGKEQRVVTVSVKEKDYRCGAPAVFASKSDGLPAWRISYKCNDVSYDVLRVQQSCSLAGGLQSIQKQEEKDLAIEECNKKGIWHKWSRSLSDLGGRRWLLLRERGQLEEVCDEKSWTTTMTQTYPVIGALDGAMQLIRDMPVSVTTTTTRPVIAVRDPIAPRF